MDVLKYGFEWVFFKKGNANAVYRYIGNDVNYKDKLLRLRLANQETDTKHVYKFVENKIRPILPETIELKLVQVDFSKAECLNDGFGLLIPSLFPFDSVVIKKHKYYQVYQSNNSITLELKPKWLIKNDYGCRNCANHRHKHKEPPSFCILHLLNEVTVVDHIKKIFTDQTIEQKFLQYFQSKDNILIKIKSLQNQLSFNLLTSEARVTEDFKLQMSLRDLSVFLKLENDKIYVTITDIDPKSSNKWRKWQETERLLHQKNFYIDH